MKVLKNVFLVIGLLVVAGAGALLMRNAWDLGILYEAMVNKSQSSVGNPTNLVLIAAGLAVVGGLLVGLGIGMPRRTAGSVRNATLEELHRGTAPVAEPAPAPVAEPTPAPVAEPTPARVAEPVPAPVAEPAPAPAPAPTEVPDQKL